MVTAAAAIIIDDTSKKLEFADVCTRSEAAKANPQPLFEENVQQIYCGSVTVDECQVSMQRHGVRSPKSSFAKR
jgi:hypothetical protein